MKTATDFATNMNNGMHEIDPAPTLSIHSALPTTTQGMTNYIKHILTVDEQAVCDRATD